jgi:hypothetical protein
MARHERTVMKNLAWILFFAWTLNGEFARAVQALEMQQVWQNIGADPIIITPEAFEKATAAEIAKLGRVVKASGAKVD